MRIEDNQFTTTLQLKSYRKHFRIMKVIQIGIQGDCLSIHALGSFENSVQPPFGCACIHYVHAILSIVSLAIGNYVSGFQPMGCQRRAHLVKNAGVMARMYGGNVSDSQFLNIPLSFRAQIYLDKFRLRKNQRDDAKSLLVCISLLA